MLRRMRVLTEADWMALIGRCQGRPFMQFPGQLRDRVHALIHNRQQQG